MEYYFDASGRPTQEQIEGRSTTVPPPTPPEGFYSVWNFVEWVLVPEQVSSPAPEPLPTKLTKRAFQDRFPLTSNGISRKYDRMDLFLRDDGYAATLGVTGANLYELRLMITTGINRLNASSHVDYSMPDAANFLTLLTNPVIPEAFRLTESERTAMLETPISESEKFTS